MLLAGLVWGQFFHVIRSLWTSSFVLETCGISTLLLASFYLICDVWGHSKWAFFFIVFGVNSIAIYDGTFVRLQIDRKYIRRLIKRSFCVKCSGFYPIGWCYDGYVVDYVLDVPKKDIY